MDRNTNQRIQTPSESSFTPLFSDALRYVVMRHIAERCGENDLTPRNASRCKVNSVQQLATTEPHGYGKLTYHMGLPAQCYLPPGRGENPTFTPAEAGTRFSDPGGM